MSTYGGAGIVRGSIFHPARGAWVADIEVNTDAAITGTQTLSLPGLDLVGTVVEGGVVGVRQKMRVVAGRGGLGKDVKGQPFNRAQVRTVVNYLLGQVGETLDAQSDAAVLGQQLAHWTHRTGSCGRGLDLLMDAIGSTWYVTPAGAIHIGDRAWLDSTVEAAILSEDQREQLRVVSALEGTVQPGTTFEGDRVTSVEHIVNGNGARSIVRWGGEGNAFDDALGDLVRHHQERTLPLYGAEVVVQHSDGSLDLKPTHDEVGPGWQRVPLYLVGTATVKVQPGARCVVEFLDNDPQQPFVRSFLSGTFLEQSTSATTLKLGGTTIEIGKDATAVKLGNGAKPVASQGDTVQVSLVSGKGTVDTTVNTKVLV